MNEEEIIKIIKEKIILDFNCYNPIDRIELEAIEGLLDLYKAEKEKNKELELFIQENPPIIPMPKEYQNNIESLGEVVTVKEKEYISKDKIKEAMKDCVSSYDCLKEKINILLYGEEYFK